MHFRPEKPVVPEPPRGFEGHNVFAAFAEDDGEGDSEEHAFLPAAAGDLGEIVLEDAFWVQLHAVLLDLRESVYKVMAVRNMSKKARKRHVAETKALLRKSQDLARAMPPETAEILAEIQLTLS